MLLNGLEHGTARLMGVGAVAETAVLGEMEYLLEITCQFLALDVERAETLDARGVDEITTGGKSKHLTERGCVHTRIMRVGNL